MRPDLLDRIPYRTADLHPVCRDRFQRLADYLEERYRVGIIRTNFRPFEGYRGPERQAALSPKVTKAGPWRSAHQFGFAVDFVA